MAQVKVKKGLKPTLKPPPTPTWLTTGQPKRKPTKRIRPTGKGLKPTPKPKYPKGLKPTPKPKYPKRIGLKK